MVIRTSEEHMLLASVPRGQIDSGCLVEHLFADDRVSVVVSSWIMFRSLLV